jgi:hypothetical protein
LLTSAGWTERLLSAERDAACRAVPGAPRSQKPRFRAPSGAFPGRLGHGLAHLLIHDLPAAVVLVLKAELDAVGRRPVQLAYFAPALQLALGDVHLSGPAFVVPGFVAYLVMRLVRSSGPEPVLAPI